MNWHSLDTEIAVVGALAAVACAIPGTLLVLRRMSLMGDAISHAVLPGLALAFIFTGSRSGFLMFAAAAVTGVITAVFTQVIEETGRIERGASMGIVFTLLFAVGLLLIVQAANHVDLDPSCVLFGAIELTPLDRVAPLGLFGVVMEVPRAAIPLAICLIVNIIFVLFFYKELKLSSFDPALAAALGFRPRLINLALMMLTAMTTVAAFEAVGSIIVVAMLIVPGATALLFSRSLSSTFLLAFLFAIVAAVSGHAFAIMLPPLFGFPGASTSGMMATTAGLLFAIVLVARGIIHRRAQLSFALKHPDGPLAANPGQHR